MLINKYVQIIRKFNLNKVVSNKDLCAKQIWKKNYVSPGDLFNYPARLSLCFRRIGEIVCLDSVSRKGQTLF